MKKKILLFLLLCSTCFAPILKPPRGMLISGGHPLTRGLVGCWLMNEGGGNTVFDVSGNGATGDIGLFGWSGGNYGNTLNYTGASQAYIDPPYFYRPLDGASEFTVIIAFNPSAISADLGLFYTDNHTGSDPLLIWIDNATTDYIGVVVTCSGGGIDVDYGTEAIVAGKQYQFSLTYKNGDDVRLFLNGIEDVAFDGSGASGTLNAATNSGMHIGNDSGKTKSFKGKIDFCYVYNRALTASEIAYLYSNPFCMFERGISPAVLYHATSVGGVETYQDEVFAVVGIQSEALDNVILSEAVDLQARCGVSAIDNLILADEIKASIIISSNVTDTHVLSDLVSTSADTSAAISDNLIYSDLVFSAIDISSKILDNAILTDETFAAGITAVEADDYRVLSDLVSTSADISAAISDNLIYSDFVFSAIDISSDILDNAIFNDGIFSIVIISSSVEDSLITVGPQTYQDEVYMVVNIGPYVTDIITITDEVKTQTEAESQVFDNFLFEENVLSRTASTASSLDELTFVDIVNSIATINNSITENGLFIDSVNVELKIQDSVLDSFISITGFIAAAAFMMLKKHR